MELTDDVKCLLELQNDNYYKKQEYLLDRWEDEKKYENPYPYQDALANYFKEQGYPNLTVEWNGGKFLIKIPVNHYQTVVITNKVTKTAFKVSVGVKEKVTA